MISILISVYNGQTDVLKTLESIYNQTYTDWEIVVVDDGSTDGTWHLLQEAKKEHPNKITIVRNEENIGLTKSLIKAEKMAKGDFLGRLDVGDIFLPQKLEKQMQFFEENPAYGLLGTTCVNMSIFPYRVKQTQPTTTDQEIRKIIFKKNPLAHSTIVIKRDLYHKAGGYDPMVRYGQDYDLWLRMINHCKVANLKEVLCVRSVGWGSISYKNQKAQMFQCIKTRLKYMNKSKPENYLYLMEPALLIIIPNRIKKWILSSELYI